ncbi:DsbE family thiol:disulfide interchange protein [Phaeobacter gallaeciensis]|uniref:DsbE family thiol:disulfide interchange protein n=1 Tax=Phaeobacter gallaeciensis TaxID=60890 RepID=UPI00237F48FF|nr:DsbE family thiol:disulfide interchange protein [Phaeobacter gallaeciensis]MDE4304329.1 DsbE family thiol:disulfide interchange protein [Phaeobacter gallaeciensis]MDE4308328.1 DsbE family thiol:disulfide interchange protein [Phaeobacter gallaeciensis]MDE4312785.1 DsbE family thiol:disulfide interchange protein [Phaeobacter gallaeciensis]MDE4317260.1 DsbE family thiol:disulfide interchange protein [Phaeobacter gallaeciensis]MDE4321723.1 DsbE family thiol:disulfide interchange protein [Phaeob
MAKISPLMAVPVVVFGGFVGLALVGMFREDPESLPSAREGQTAPPVVLDDFAGKPSFDDATLRDGTVKLVNYWASWCAPCRAEHPTLEALSAEGVPIYGVNYKDQQDNAEAFLNELGDPYTAIGRDEKGRMAIDWGLYGVPETYVIDGEGKIVLRFAGPLTSSVVEKTLRPAMEKAAGQ